ncbi:MAG: dihydrolipoamide acyltransferase [Acidimicrobiia bacterium]|nr:dihydrolipoamide acyltransferase [bacterium]MXX64257.1 dihydrolipoamide acyltransferase [Acidimicrobiia bacterium]MCY3580782.1 dihydrolipoamide acyltransferase [bacterium]MCY3652060.1 dihydrolipoamide acyltransferase [bacterium]MDE0642873.1 dihydrolipoamide acyltransferase [bacterium]
MSEADVSDQVALTIPQMGVVEEVVVIEWLVEEGSTVSEGQEVVVIETEKAEVALEAPSAGTIRIVVEPSDYEVPVGTTLAYINP